MAIPSSITDLDTNEAMNSPAGSDNVGGTLDNFLRSHAAIIRRQFSEGADINSASTTVIPPDCSFANVVKVVSTINGFSDNFNGRIVYLKFDAGITLAHSSALVMPGNVSAVTEAGDVAAFVNESAGVWRCLSYPRNAEQQWLGTPIGGYITPFAAPPKDNPKFRYVLCTAGNTGAGGYNEGILTGETVTGTAPLLIAKATISLAGSPMNGVEIPLINTEGRFVGAGTSEALENDSIQNITGAISLGNTPGLAPTGAFTVSQIGGTTATGTGVAGRIGIDASLVARTSDRTQPRAHRLPHYRRIM